MSSPIEELALKDFLRHPKLILLYAAFVGVGWLGERLVPSQQEKDADRWRQAYYQEHKERDSVQRSHDLLLIDLINQKKINERQHQTIQTADSLLTPLGKKAQQILKRKHNEN